MMVYFDTNVWVYAFSKNVDSEEQKSLAIKYIEAAMKDETIVVSEVILCEMAFILQKLEESQDNIDERLSFLSEYVKTVDVRVHQRMIEILKETNLYGSSFDVYHLAFSEYYQAKLVTFDKGFKKLKNNTKIKIIIL